MFQCSELSRRQTKASFNGSISSIPGWNDSSAAKLFDTTKKSGAGRAVGISIDDGRLLPISSAQNGTMGISDISLSLPTVVGRNGVVAVWEPDVTDAEKEGLMKSAASLKETFAVVEGQLAGSAN